MLIVSSHLLASVPASAVPYTGRNSAFLECCGPRFGTCLATENNCCQVDIEGSSSVLEHASLILSCDFSKWGLPAYSKSLTDPLNLKPPN